MFSSCWLALGLDWLLPALESHISLGFLALYVQTSQVCMCLEMDGLTMLISNFFFLLF